MLTISSIGILLGLISLIMASELRWITLIGTVAGGTTQDDSVATFRNESAEELDLIVISESHTTLLMNAAESSTLELSKSPTASSRVDQDGTYRHSTTMRGPSGTATIVEGGEYVNRSTRYDDGEVTLESQEAVFVNVLSTSAVSTLFEYNIGFRFGSD